MIEQGMVRDYRKRRRGEGGGAILRVPDDSIFVRIQIQLFKNAWVRIQLYFTPRRSCSKIALKKYLRTTKFKYRQFQYV
jgi:hypothetical protein